MALFNGVESLLDMFMPQQNTPAKDNLVRRTELDSNDFDKIASVGLPAIIEAINRNNQSPEGLESFNNALLKHQDVNEYNSVDQLTRNVDENDGDKILNHVFNNNSNEKQGVIERIANMFSISEGAVKRVLVLLAPVVLKYFADRKNDKNLDDKGVRQESGNLSDMMSRSIRDFSTRQRQQRTPDNNGGILGDILDGRGQNNQNRTGNNNNGGILGDILSGMTQNQNRRNQSSKQNDNILDNILDLFK